MGKESQAEQWPQRIDTLFNLDDFSKLLVKNGLEPLTQGERHVLCGFDPVSQWDLMLAKKIRIIESEQSLVANEDRDASLPFLSNTLRKFRKLVSSRKLYHPTIAITRSNISADERGFPPKPKYDNKSRDTWSETVFTSPFLIEHDEEDEIEEDDNNDEVDGEVDGVDDQTHLSCDGYDVSSQQPYLNDGWETAQVYNDPYSHYNDCDPMSYNFEKEDLLMEYQPDGVNGYDVSEVRGNYYDEGDWNAVANGSMCVPHVGKYCYPSKVMF
jgi:hypothetical protein